MATTAGKLGCALGALAAGGVLVLVAVSIGRNLAPSSAPAASASAAIHVDNSAPADVVALLDGLRPGDKFGDWVVSRISTDAPRHRFRIELEQPQLGWSVFVEKKGATPAPRQTDKYSIFYGNAFEQGAAKMPAGYQDSVMDAVVTRIQKTEASAPVPAGL